MNNKTLEEVREQFLMESMFGVGMNDYEYGNESESESSCDESSNYSILQEGDDIEDGNVGDIADVLYLGSCILQQYRGWDDDGKLKVKSILDVGRFIRQMKANRLSNPNYNPFMSYSTVVISDDCLEYYYKHLEHVLKQFYHGVNSNGSNGSKGGSIIVLGEMGVFALPGMLGVSFDCKWKFGEYCRYNLKVNQLVYTQLKLPKMNDIRYTKHNYLLVPNNDALISPTDDPNDPDASNYENNLSPLASHIGVNGGRLTYISCVNAHEEFVTIYRKIVKLHVHAPVIVRCGPTVFTTRASITNPTTTASTGSGVHILQESRITEMAELHGYHYAGRDIGTHMIAFEKVVILTIQNIHIRDVHNYSEGMLITMELWISLSIPVYILGKVIVE